MARTTPWEEFSGVEPAVFSRPGNPRTVIDCWRCLDAGECGRFANYVATGPGAATGTLAEAQAEAPLQVA